MKLCVLIPGKNEALVIGRTIQSVLAAHIPAKDIYVVDDGSTDDTAIIASTFNVNVWRNEVNIGKAASITHANKLWKLDDRYFGICLMDADSIVNEDYYERVAEAFLSKPNVAVVSANTKSIRCNWLTAYRAMVYCISNWVYKQGQDVMGVITVVPGFAASYSSKAFKGLTWDSDTVTEDMDTTIQVHKKGLGSIVYAKEADTYTQDPNTLADYRKQIYRWHTGAWQVGKKHKCFFGKSKIDLEFTFLMVEALLFSLFYMLLPLWLFLWPKWIAIGLSLEYSVLLAVSVICALATKRWDVLMYSPLFVIARATDCYILVKSFFNTVVRRKKERGWNQVKRYV